MTSQGTPLQEVTDKDIQDIVKTLNNQKSTDIHGISAEHIKLSSPLIFEVLKHLANAVIKSGKMPLSFKIGSIIPVLKKSKTAKNPNSYRCITITSIIGKVIEKHMIKQAKPILEHQSHLQFGFFSGCSPSYAALVLTELMAEAKDPGTELYITFMDTSKAFDVVRHE